MKENKLWETSPFIALVSGRKIPISKGWAKGEARLKLNELNNHDTIGFVPPAGFIVIDCDNEESVSKVENLIKILNIKPTTYPTTRGKHYIFRKPQGKYFEEMVSQAGVSVFSSPEGKYKDSDIDAKGSCNNESKQAAGFVCVKTKGEWRINPQDLFDAYESNVPECPLSLLVTSRIKFSIDEYKAGARDDYMFRHVAIFRSKGWTEEQFIKFCVEIKMIAKDKESIDETIEWAKRKWESSQEMGEVQDMTQNKTWNEIVESAQKKKGKKKKEDPNDSPEIIQDFKKKLLKWTKEKDVFLAIQVINFRELADIMIDELKLQYSAEDNQIWGLQFGEFAPVMQLDILVKRWMIATFRNIKTAAINEMKSYLEGAIPVKKFVNNKFIISFKNKDIDVMKFEEVKLDKRTMAQNLIPHNFVVADESKKKYIDFLDNAMKKWTKGHKQLEKQIYERVGLIMTKYMGHEKSYFLLGSGSNGKSAFLDLLIKSIGTNNVSHEDLKVLSADKDGFSAANLYGKLANINLDISGDVIQDPSLFKKLVSGDRISASFKGKNKFAFEPYATQVFGANNIPYANEGGDSDAINRRMEIWPFLSVIKADEMSDREKLEFTEMIESEELVEVFIYKSILATHNALNSHFTVSKISAQALDKVKREYNVLYEFVEESGVKDNETKKDAYERFYEWASKNGHKNSFRSRDEFVKKYINVARNYGITMHDETYEGDTYKRHRLLIEKDEE